MKLTCWAVVPFRTFDGVVDVHDTVAVVTVVPLRALVTGGLPCVLLIEAAGADGRGSTVFRAVMADCAEVGIRSSLPLGTVVSSTAVSWYSEI